ncbi:MAG: C39 family peptidase [Anaerolineae bacterium]|nr:C39 family peptidase [Anaerolineae bacterium]
MRHTTVLLILLITLISVLLTPTTPLHAQDGDALPASARVTGLRHEFQTWNNCGPVNLTMVLSYYGWPHDQQVAAAWLKPTVEDRNVSPWELVAYVEHQTDQPDLRAITRIGGDLDLLKAFVAAGFPVIVESGFQPEGHEWMGHYITVVAYDDAVETIWTYDSYNGYGVGYGEETSYTEFDALWRHFNRTFIVVYPHTREDDVRTLLGSYLIPPNDAQIALSTAQAEIAATPGDPWAHFNAGTSAVELGDYESASRHYDRAFAIGLPFRMLWYQFGPYAAYYHTRRYFDMLALAGRVEEHTTAIEDTHIWRGLAYHGLERPDLALEQFDIALAWNPNHVQAQQWRVALVAGTFGWPGPVLVPPADIP